MLARLTALLASLSLAAAQQSFAYQGYFPINAPTSSQGWVSGETNVLEWDVGWDSFTNALPPSFDVRLAAPFSTHPPLFIATKVPLDSSSLAVYLDASVPTGDGYYLSISDSYSGQVFAQSEKFSIAGAGASTATGLSSPKSTATLKAENDNPAKYAATLAGKPLPTYTDGNNKVYYAAAAQSVISRSLFGPLAALAVGAVAAGALLS